MTCMKQHHESKHSKVKWDPSIYIDTHKESGGVTTAGIFVKGSGSNKKIKIKAKKSKKEKSGKIVNKKVHGNKGMGKLGKAAAIKKAKEDAKLTKGVKIGEKVKGKTANTKKATPVGIIGASKPPLAAVTKKVENLKIK